jgi:hypothetical protein
VIPGLRIATRAGSAKSPSRHQGNGNAEASDRKLLFTKCAWSLNPSLDGSKTISIAYAGYPTLKPPLNFFGYFCDWLTCDRRRHSGFGFRLSDLPHHPRPCTRRRLKQQHDPA